MDWTVADNSHVNQVKQYVKTLKKDISAYVTIAPHQVNTLHVMCRPMPVNTDNKYMNKDCECDHEFTLMH